MAEQKTKEVELYGETITVAADPLTDGMVARKAALRKADKAALDAELNLRGNNENAERAESLSRDKGLFNPEN